VSTSRAAWLLAAALGAVPRAPSPVRGEAELVHSIMATYEYSLYLPANPSSYDLAVVAGWLPGELKPGLSLHGPFGFLPVRLVGRCTDWIDQMSHGTTFPHRRDDAAPLRDLGRGLAALRDHLGPATQVVAYGPSGPGAWVLLATAPASGLSAVWSSTQNSAVPARLPAGVADAPGSELERLLDLAIEVGLDPPTEFIACGPRAVAAARAETGGAVLRCRLRDPWRALESRLAAPVNARGIVVFTENFLRGREAVTADLAQRPFELAEVAEFVSCAPRVLEGESFTRQDVLLWLIED
jgi:hypothetical protein